MCAFNAALRSIAFLTALGAMAAQPVQAADCNQNGIDDARDVLSADVGFTLPRAVEAGAEIRDVIPVDWSGDGQTDLILLGKYADIYLLENLGGRRWGAPRKMEWSWPIVALEAADLDGDGAMDLLAADDGCDECIPSIRDRVVTHLNKGGGVFEAGKPMPLEGEVLAVAVRDVTGSPSPDLFVLLEEQMPIFFHRNDGKGSFEPAIPIDCDRFPTSLNLADLNADGLVDLLVQGEKPHDPRDRRFSDPGSSWLAGDGKGDFSLQSGGIEASASFNRIAVDLTGDGAVDIPAGRTREGVGAYFNDGNGGFSPLSQLREIPGDHAFCLAAGDFNGDGWTDLAAAHGDAVTVIRNEEKGILSVRETYFAPLLEGAPVAADLDSDGRLDLAMVRQPDGLTLLFGHDDGTFDGIRGSPARGVDAVDVLADDLDGDGRKDLLISGSGFGAYAYLNRQVWTLGKPLHVDAGGQGAISAISADFDGDGNVDVALRSGPCEPCFPESRELAIYFNDGAGKFTFGAAGLPEFLNGALRAVDLNADGLPDLIAHHYGGIFTILWSEGGRSYRRDALIDLSEFADGDTFAAADVNGDGLPDLMYHDSATGVVVVLNNGNGTMASPLRRKRPIPNGDPFLPLLRGGAVADLNGDSLADLAQGDEELIIGLSSGDGTFTRTAVAVERGSVGAIAALDADGDGDLDLAAHLSCNVFCGPLEPFSEVTFFRNNGEGGFTPFQSVPVGPAPWEMAAADSDGDGRTDIMGFSGGNSIHYLLLNRSDTGFEVSSRLATRSRLQETDHNHPLPVPSKLDFPIDLDGDGDLDLVLARRDILVLVENHTVRAHSRDTNLDGVPDECQEAPFHRGDPNDDGRTDVADAVFIAKHLFRGGAMSACAEAEDTDNNGKVNLADTILLLSYLFEGGLPPEAPGPMGQACSRDPDPMGSPESLGCERYTSC